MSSVTVKNLVACSADAIIEPVTVRHKNPNIKNGTTLVLCKLMNLNVAIGTNLNSVDFRE